MAQLRQDYESFKQKDAEIVVVGPENSDKFKAYFSENKLPFIGLSDPQHSVLKTYGQEIKLFKFGRMPAQMLIDKTGNVRFIHYGHNMADIPPNEEILGLLDELNSEI